MVETYKKKDYEVDISLNEILIDFQVFTQYYLNLCLGLGYHNQATQNDGDIVALNV